MEVVVTTGANRGAKLQSNHNQQTNIRLFLQAGCPFSRQTNRCQSTEGKICQITLNMNKRTVMIRTFIVEGKHW